MAIGFPITTALLVAISGPPADTASSVPQPPEPGAITFRACNQTSSTLLIATSYIPVDGEAWRNKGWKKISAGSCEDIFTTTNKAFYARAEVKGNAKVFWGSDIKLCAEYPGPYEFDTQSGDTTCPEGEPTDFTTFHSDGSPIFLWNLKS